MTLYVDDNLVGSNGVTTNQGYGGYWRVGGDNLNAWPDQPSSAYFNGTIDEVAIYDGTAVGHPGRRPLPGVRPHAGLTGSTTCRTRSWGALPSRRAPAALHLTFAGSRQPRWPPWPPRAGQGATSTGSPTPAPSSPSSWPAWRIP